MNNPIINSPYIESKRHFKADERGISDEIVEARRPSARYVSAMPRTRKRDRQLSMNLAEGAFSAEMQEDNEFINKIRFLITEWRRKEYPGITKTSRDLLYYWQDENRENKLFFCQIEALETLIYLNEVAEKAGETWVLNDLRRANEEANPGLYRLAFKMATGSGKTVVMAMMIAYHTLNKVRYPQDTRFTDAFAILTPGITIRDRLNVLHPNDPQNYYIKRDIVSHQDFELLQGAVVLVMNYHQMGLRDNQRFQMGGTLKATKLIKAEVQKESPNAMIQRAFKSLSNKSRILVINDEAHHCYREKPTDEKLSGDDRKEADENNEAARVWISGLEALTKKLNVNAILDLSATPYFLRGSGYEEGTLFPWTVSDFSLLDALECGVVKIPRLPVESNTIKQTEMPEFRNLWDHISDDPHMPKKGLKKAGKEEGYDLNVIVLPTKLQEALLALYGSYETYYKEYEAYKKKNPAVMPPVMIVVCNNTTVSKMIYRWIAGYEIETQTRIGIEKGNLPIFRNEDGVNMIEKPNTLIVDSAQLESGEQIDAEFKKSFAKEIEDFHKEYRRRFQGRDEPSDAELLREVMNTVGKPGKLGENLKCVVSVSMLTEGWDCLDAETEILTLQGWRGMGQVQEGDWIYSLNRETEEMDIVPILEYGERPIRVNERMVHFKSQHFDIRVTEGHEFHLKYRNPRDHGNLSRGWIAKKAGEMVERSSAYALPISAEYPDFPGVPLTDDELRMIAWFMTDGGFTRSNVAISQSKPFRDEIRELLSRLELDYTERIVEPTKYSYPNSQPAHVFRIPKGTHTGSLARNGWNTYSEYLDKLVAPALHQMTREQFLVFWEELLKGDGEKQGNKAGWLWCCEKAQADAYTHMAIVRGLSASYHEEITNSGKIVYRVSVRDKKWMLSDPGDMRAAKISFEDPEAGEIVWCVRNQNSTLVTRRNGKTAILGNCNTVTHILGVRAFTTQLLCEQVVGRALRRVDYNAELDPEDGVEKFSAEYAEVYGVPFNFLKAEAAGVKQPPKFVHRVHALEGREQYEIHFPRLEGYRYELDEGKLGATFTEESRTIIENEPTKTTSQGAIGDEITLDMGRIKDMREGEVSAKLAEAVLKKYYRDGDGTEKYWLYPQIKRIVDEYVRAQVRLKDNMVIGYLLVGKYLSGALTKIQGGIIKHGVDQLEGGERRLLPILAPFDALGSTRYVDFLTTKPVQETVKSHVNYVVADTAEWEQGVARRLEEMPEVLAYVKNQNLGFTIPYEYLGMSRQYVPDFIARLDMSLRGRQPEAISTSQGIASSDKEQERPPRNDILNLLIEVTGKKDDKKGLKVKTAREMWIPAVNNTGKYGAWAMLEIQDIHETMNLIRAGMERGFDHLMLGTMFE